VIEFEIKGGKELERSLARLEERVERKIATQANRAGAALLKKRITSRMPRSGLAYPRKRSWKLKSGSSNSTKQDRPLSKSIAVRKVRGAGMIKHHVGVTGWARAYAHILEFGSKFQAPNPIWRKALKNDANAVFDAVGLKIRQGLEKHG